LNNRGSFEPFFTTKGPKEGTGLGLSIVRQLSLGMRERLLFEESQILIDNRNKLDYISVQLNTS